MSLVLKTKVKKVDSLLLPNEVRVEYLERNGMGANYRLKFGVQEQDANHNSLYIKKRYIGQHENEVIDESLVQVLDYAPQTAPKHINMQPPKKKVKAYRPDRKRVSVKNRTEWLKEQ